MPVDTKHPDYDKYATKWRHCRDVYAGQDAIHAGGSEYLPRLKEQEEDDYKAYLLRAPFYNATYRTISGLVGMVFRQPPNVECPDAMLEMMNDVTLSGIPLQTLAETVVDESLTVGRIGLLVDYPNVNVEGLTAADGQRLNLRPTIQTYCAETIINWRTKTINNQNVLVLVVLEEQVEAAGDAYEHKTIKQWRVLELIEGKYRVQIWQKDIRDQFVQIGTDIFPTMQNKPLDYIPFVFAGPDDLQPDIEAPPLIDLVNLNLSHYRTGADYEHGAHFTGMPTPVVTGYTPEDASKKLYIGSQSAWVFPKPDAKAFYLEFTGGGLETLEKLIARKEAQMAILGARMLEPQKKGVEASDTASIHRKGEESMLSALSQTLSMALEKCLKWFAAWAALNPDDIVFQLNRDFYPANMDPTMLTALVSAWQQGAISEETLFMNLQQGEIISQDVTFEEEQQKRDDEAQRFAQQAADAAALTAGQVADATGVVPPTKKAA